MRQIAAYISMIIYILLWCFFFFFSFFSLPPLPLPLFSPLRRRFLVAFRRPIAAPPQLFHGVGLEVAGRAVVRVGRGSLGGGSSGRRSLL